MTSIRMLQKLTVLVAFLASITFAMPLRREVPQEHSHEPFLTSTRASLNINNPDQIKDPVFGLLGNAAAAAGLGKISDINCLQQATADQAFTNAKAAGDVQGQVDALIYRALERNSGQVGLATAACTSIKAVNPEIAAIQQHQDPASTNATAINKAIVLELARQIQAVGGDPQDALKSGTFAPGNLNDATAKGNTCDDANDPNGCIFTQNLLVPDATAEEIQAAVGGAASANATTAAAASAINTTAAATEATNTTTTVTDTASTTATTPSIDLETAATGTCPPPTTVTVTVGSSASATTSASISGSSSLASSNSSSAASSAAGATAAAATATAVATSHHSHHHTKSSGASGKSANATATAAASTLAAALETASANATVAASGTASATATATATASSTGDSLTGNNLQKFTGSLGGAAAPAVTTGGRGFVVEGSSSFLNIGAAIGRSCDIQHNNCANFANSAAGRASGLSVSQCDAQDTACRAAN